MSWRAAANPPVQLWDGILEIGATVLLYDGRTLTIGTSNPGGTSATALYNPVANTWATGPNLPGNNAADDAPAAVMPNGHVLVVADRGFFNGPSSMFEYDPIANQFTSVPDPTPGFNNSSCFLQRFLQLPNGQILVSNAGSQLYAYTPSGTALASWRPTVMSVTSNGGGVFTLRGTQLNGLTEGCYYGDDVAMSSNFPLVRLVNNTTGSVTYARTFNFSTMAVATGRFTPVSCQFQLPSLPIGSYTLYAVANGIPSNGFRFTDSGGAAPSSQSPGGQTPPQPGASLMASGGSTPGDGSFVKPPPSANSSRQTGGEITTSLPPALANPPRSDSGSSSAAGAVTTLVSMSAPTLDLRTDWWNALGAN